MRSLRENEQPKGGRGKLYNCLFELALLGVLITSCRDAAPIISGTYHRELGVRIAGADRRSRGVRARRELVEVRLRPVEAVRDGAEVDDAPASLERVHQQRGEQKVAQEVHLRGGEGGEGSGSGPLPALTVVLLALWLSPARAGRSRRR